MLNLPGQPPTLSIIDAGLAIAGNLQSERQVDGDVRSKLGAINGNIIPRDVAVRDRIKEDICTDLVRLQGTARVESEIVHAPYPACCGHEATSPKLLSDIPELLTKLLDQHARILFGSLVLGRSANDILDDAAGSGGSMLLYGEIFAMDGMKMKTLGEQIEEMRLRMNDWAKSEVGLVTTLGHSLTEADNKLLDDVRNLASEHEARRAEILKELQGLASRLGVLPTSREPFAPINDAAPLPTPVTRPGQSELARGHSDRRTSLPSMADELTKHLAARTAGR
jgi:hypothetical protein